MTLPFRRRHHDNDASHDHAREMVARSFLEPLPLPDQAWLDSHVEACPECRVESESYVADRRALRQLRERMPEPPRDLWARTAAAIEREGRRHPRSAPLTLQPARAGRRPTGLSLGILSGTLVALVIVATSVLRPGPVPIVPSTGTQFVVVPTTPAATPLTVPADPLAFIRQSDDGSYQLVFATVDKVCPDEKTGCAPLADGSSARIKISAEPQSVVLSPSSEQLIVATAADASGGGEILVVPIPQPTGGPPESPSTSGAPSSAAPGTASPTSTATVGPTTVPSAGPSATPSGSPEPPASPTPTPAPTPDGARAIASGVRLVGDPRYSADGRWLAFSARPMDGSAGPDLYVWQPGQASATRLTDDHATYFAGWTGDLILASRIVGGSPDPAASPSPSSEPSASHSFAPPTPATSAIVAPVATSSPGGAASPDASVDPSAVPAPVEMHPISFALDPATGAGAELPIADMWQPVVDSAGRFVVYWSGTVVAEADGSGWRPATGRVILDAWSAPVLPDPSASPSDAMSAPPATAEASLVPGGSASSPSTSISSAGPSAGTSSGPTASDSGALPTVLVDGTVAAFHARFDPRGSRLAIWWTKESGEKVGTLRMVVLDPDARRIDPARDPLPGVTALDGFSLQDGRLAWATPPGQDGEGSHVQVLGWAGNEFGQVQTFPAQKMLVVR